MATVKNISVQLNEAATFELTTYENGKFEIGITDSEPGYEESLHSDWITREKLIEVRDEIDKALNNESS